MSLVDTHTHIFLEEFDSDRKDVITRALENGVEHCFLPNIDLSTIDALHNCCDSFPGVCKPLMGLHPCSVKSNYQDELDQIEKQFDKHKYFGVGEAGLDLYWDKSHFKEQIDALRVQAGWAKALDLPLILHSRDSFDELYEVIKEEQDGRLKGIFHCFTGDIEDAKRVRDLGFYMGIGGVLTFKNGGLDKKMKNMPLDGFVLETDAPYLTPSPYRGKRNEPAYTRLVAEKMSSIFDCSFKIIEEHTNMNAKRIFKF